MLLASLTPETVNLRGLMPRGRIRSFQAQPPERDAAWTPYWRR